MEVYEKRSTTFEYTIWVGLKEGYHGPTHDESEVLQICREYCDEVGLCVTITPTTFVYPNGVEPGVAVGLINYPRFPKHDTTIEKHALKLARILMTRLGQHRISVVGPRDTIMIGPLDD